MSKYVDADKLVTHLKDELEGCKKPVGGRACGKSIAYGTALGLTMAISFAETLPTADAVEVRHGEWVDNHCTVCGMQPIGDEVWTSIGLTPPIFKYCLSFCPCCGARMDGERREK